MRCGASSGLPARLWHVSEHGPARWTLDSLVDAAQAEGSTCSAARSAEFCRPRGCAGATRSWAPSNDPDFAPDGRAAGQEAPLRAMKDRELPRVMAAASVVVVAPAAPVGCITVDSVLDDCARVGI